MAISMGQSGVSGWKNIVAIACGESHTVGLRKDGSVVAVGRTTVPSSLNPTVCQYPQEIAVIFFHEILILHCPSILLPTATTKQDGTVVAAGDNQYGQCNVASWKDIRAIACGGNYTLGIQKDGTVENVQKIVIQYSAIYLHYKSHLHYFLLQSIFHLF